MLALSEHVAFAVAYAAAAGTNLVVVALYAWRTVGRAAGRVLALLVAAVEGYFYVLLGLEDYALLAGSIGLFAVLVVAMVATRNVDWHKAGTALVERARS